LKVLLDENLPRALLRVLSHHEVQTVDSMGWKGIKNGELLKLVEAQRFDVFLTGDKNLAMQHNLKGRRLTLLVMSAVNWPIIEPYLPAICKAVDEAQPETVGTVQCGVFLPQAKHWQQT